MSLDHGAPPARASAALVRQLVARLVTLVACLLGDATLAAESTEHVLLEQGALAEPLETRALLRSIVQHARARITRPSCWTEIESLLPSFSALGAHLEAQSPLENEAQRPEAARSRIAALPALHRAVLVLCDGEGLTVAECAQWLDLPLASVRLARHQARQALMTLARRGEE